MQDELLGLRKKQIESLEQQFHNLVTITRDAIFDVPITTPTVTFFLRVSLGSQFPTIPPLVRIYSQTRQLTHRLVDKDGNVSQHVHPKLLQWTTRTHLGKIIWEIVNFFAQEPPAEQPLLNMHPLVHYPNQSQSQSSQSGLNSASSWTSSYPNVSPSVPYGSTAGLVGFSSSNDIPELDNMSLMDINGLLTKEQTFQAFFEGLPSVRGMKEILDRVCSNSENLAQQNLLAEKELGELKRNVAALHQVVQEKKLAFDQKAHRQQQVMQQFTASSLLEKLNAAALEAENESDELAKIFIRDTKSFPPQDFVKSFLDKRKQHHMRAAKREFLKALSPHRNETA